MRVFNDKNVSRDILDPQFVHQLVDQVALENPDGPAVVSGSQTLTYSQLVRRANELCQAILQADTDARLIGVSTGRNLEMVIGVLAILKAGKAYLPLDPAYPEQRLQQIITDSGLRTSVSTAQNKALFEKLGLTNIVSDAEPAYTPQPVRHQGSTAYVLYTSGSTGNPKGVCMGHGPLMNLLQWQQKNSIAGPDSRTLQLAPLSFDVSFQEIFATLTTGGTLVLVDDALRLDLNALLQFIDQQAVNRLFLPFVALQYLAEAAVSLHQFPKNLREIMTAGEQLKITPQIARFFSELPACVLYNQYGPTECHVITQLKLDGDPANWPHLPTIGHVIDHVNLFVVDEQLTILPDGEVGELCFSGACLAEGYLNQPALTNEKFISLPIPSAQRVERVYRTGDLGRLLPDGTIEFLGRRDDQVKIRGHRVELGEIEVILNHTAGIKQAVVMARDTADAQKQLVAYLIATAGHTDTATVRRELEQRLPEYMMPSAFVWMTEFPKTSSGKVDKKQLPEPSRRRPELTSVYRKPKTGIEQTVASLWSKLLRIDKVGLDDNFFELGGNSLLAQKTVAALSQEHYVLPVTRLYQYPTVAGIARCLQPNTPDQAGRLLSEARSSEHNEKNQSADVAVIGMSGRFPGANTIDELWDVLTLGKETTRFFTDAELDSSVPNALRHDPSYVKARGIIDQADYFDAQFFGLTPITAQLMDPQQRIFMEIAWEALEQTGYLPQQYTGRVGVFAGSGNNTYYLNNILGHKELIDQVGAFQVMTLNEKDYIASRTAYQLNLKGPAVSVYSACSTSLLAITQAVQSIRTGQCDVALAGGASITTPINSGHLYQEGVMLSRDGHCRSFDADAQGTVFSDGAGVVLLKSLDAARRDGDTVYAVIKGVGVNNDGGGKGSFSAPNADGQAGAIAMAIADAAIDPATISYVEAHGTATPLGDPIEIEGLTQAFGEQEQKQYCAIGSIKSNMGHLTQAAGVAGFIKTTLALYHRQIPASLNFSSPNPVIDFANSPFFVNTTLREWTLTDDESASQKENPRPANPRPANPRRAGVSSFGVGGTNVHVVLEEFQPEIPVSSDGQSGNAADQKLEAPHPRAGQAQLITWSARTVASQKAYARQLTEKLQQDDSIELADVAFTLQTTRPNFRYRSFVIATSATELTEKLLAEPTPQRAEGGPEEVVFLFPGQGSQYLNMGRMLYEQEATFRQAVDQCADLLAGHLDRDIREVMYPEVLSSEAEQRLKNTRYTQPALFVTEYAMARLWMSWGIKPSIFCGHSVGEFVAGHLAGIFSLSDALTLIAARGRMVSQLPRGGMLSVRMEVAKVQELLPETLSVAAINSYTLCVVAGPDEHIADFSRLLDDREIPNQPLATSHAFHSMMMDPIVDDFATIVAGVRLRQPTMPIISTVTGSWLTDSEAVDPQYWANHLRATVRFSDALDTIFTLEKPLLLEVGPGHVTATLARQQAGKKPVTVLAGVPNQPDWAKASHAIVTTLGQLFLNGIDPDWKAFYAGQKRTRLRLPTYAFDKKRCWIDPVVTASTPVVASAQTETVSEQSGLDDAAKLPYSAAVQHKHTSMRKDDLLLKVNQLLEDASGIEMAGVAPDTSFLEIGFDSLLLTQVALNLKKEFSLPITFRQLTSTYTSPESVAAYLDQLLPVEVPVQQPVPVHQSVPTPVMAPAPASFTGVANPPAVAFPQNDTALGLIAQQLQLMAKQVALLQGGAPQPVPVAAPQMPVPVQGPVSTSIAKDTIAADSTLTPEEKVELKKPFGATARIERQASALTRKQQDFLAQLTQRYNRKTNASKAYAQQHRSHMADPRVVSGFRPLTKEIVYPLVVNRSKGSHLWDIDGNEYIDALNGFGSNLFGYQPDFIKEVLHEQIENGYEVGPQHELAGEVSQLIAELTGAERVALCNTGSEAVLGAMRVARTVTGRSLIVAFSGSYHGIVDEVLVRGTKKLKSFPAAPGIMPESVQNMLILDYGTEESLQLIRERAHELAAVLVEPVQSRRPEFVPVEFLKQVRDITTQSGTVLIFDEVITGFRTHPGGTQALFGIRADLASYGKVVSAGLPIGVIAGKRAFMDALDGGFWQYGDASVPEVGVTYFAGTFVRHPLALAAAKAALTYMKKAGPQLQAGLTKKTERLVNAMNEVIAHRQLPILVASFGSLWKIKFTEEVPYAELLFTLMREKGIHIWDGFPCFLTEAHTDEEIDTLIHHFTESIRSLVSAGFFVANKAEEAHTTGELVAGNTPPAPGARIGRDRDGNPAWFIPNPDQPGKYLQVELKLSTNDRKHYYHTLD